MVWASASSCQRLPTNGYYGSIPSDAGATMHRMWEVSDQSRSRHESFASRWLTPIILVFLRATRDPALAYDLATETLATARIQWESAPTGDQAVAWAIDLGCDLLAATVARRRVPSTERQRGNNPRPHRLTAAEQQQIMALAEAHLELPPSAQAAADALARTAPPRHVLANLRLSELVEREPLPHPQVHHE